MRNVNNLNLKRDERKRGEKNRKEKETHIYSILDNRNSIPVRIIVSILMLLLKCLT
jgi:hypothetical protein